MTTILSEYDSCTLCPHNCNVNRNSGDVGVCGEVADLRLSFAGLHFGEEPLITGAGGSGTVFVTGCNLRCAFCQNFQISQEHMGKPVKTDEFIAICRALEKAGAENINIVTGSHAIPALAHGLRQLKAEGFPLPICWNTSSYEGIEALELLKDIVDIWLPDLKTFDTQLSALAFHAKNYPDVARNAILWMKNNSTTELEEIGSGDPPSIKLTKGLVMRHLMLPNCSQDSIAIIRWFKEHIDSDGYLSLMSQYTPIPAREKAIHEIFCMENRLVSTQELDILLDALDSLDIENGFYQELEPSGDWLPDFNRKQPFSNTLAKPIWHWKYGFL